MLLKILALLSGLAGLFSRVLDFFTARLSREDGRREAEGEAQQAALESVKKADLTAEQAQLAHAKDETDRAFDPDFWRD